MRKVTKIFVHCSASEFGDSEVINSWHINDKGWNEIGYHYVILNGYPKSRKKPYIPQKDGEIENGRDIRKAGSHCKGHNANSIGICVIGIDKFTDAQKHALNSILVGLLIRFENLTPEDIVGHYEYDTKGKTCPNMDMDKLRKEIEVIYNNKKKFLQQDNKK